MLAVEVKGAGFEAVNGVHYSVSTGIANIPVGFVKTCDENGWYSSKMWEKLYDKTTPWFAHNENDSYMYRNRSDGRWWIMSVN